MLEDLIRLWEILGACMFFHQILYASILECNLNFMRNFPIKGYRNAVAHMETSNPYFNTYHKLKNHNQEDLLMYFGWKPLLNFICNTIKSNSHH